MSVYSDLILAHPALFAYYRLADAAFPMTDEVGSQDGTLNGSAAGFTFQQFGALFNDPNEGLEVLGAGTNFVEFPYNLKATSGGFWDYLTPGGFTMECWFFRPYAAISHKDENIMGGWNGGGFMVWVSFFTGEYGIAHDNSTWYLESGVYPAREGWDHVVTTFDPAVGTDGFLYLYVNGALRSSLDLSIVTGYTPKRDLFGNPPMRLAQYNGGNNLAGVLDEVAFYSGALTADEVKEHYLIGLRETYAFPNVVPIDEFHNGTIVSNWANNTIGVGAVDNWENGDSSGVLSPGNWNTYCDAYPYQDMEGVGPAVFGPDCETWVEVTEIGDGTGWNFGQWLGIVSPGGGSTTARGYGYRANATTLEILRLDPTLVVTVLASVAWTPQIGVIGMSRVGSRLTVFVDRAAVLSVVDATYSAAGVCGLFATTPALAAGATVSTKFQRFAAGTFTPPVTFRPQVISYLS